MLTYEKAACDHQVAEVLAGHQRESALLLELPAILVINNWQYQSGQIVRI